MNQRTVSAEIAAVAADVSDWEPTAVGAAAGVLIVAVKVDADAEQNAACAYDPVGTVLAPATAEGAVELH